MYCSYGNIHVAMVTYNVHVCIVDIVKGSLTLVSFCFFDFNQEDASALQEMSHKSK